VSNLDLLVPATITVLPANAALSSLDQIPPGGITVTDPNVGGTLTVYITASNASTGLTASGLAGAAVYQNGNRLTLTGSQIEVDSALASLEITEATSSGADALTITAVDTLSPTVQSEVAVSVVSSIGPVFVAPPSQVSLTPDALDALPLLFTDSIASGLAAMGLPGDETLTLTLSVPGSSFNTGTGNLLLASYNPLGSSGVTAAGLGTGTIVLTFTAGDIAAVNALLAGLDYTGPKGYDEIDYKIAVNGTVAPATDGNIFIIAQGPLGASRTYSAGGQTVAIGGETIAGTLSVSGEETLRNGVSGQASVTIAAGSAFNVPDSNLTLSGTNLVFGSLNAAGLLLNAVLNAPGGDSLAGILTLGANATFGFGGLLDVDGAETLDFAGALSLGAGAVLAGGGTLQTGNFSESGEIYGTGTVLAPGGDTLTLNVGEVTSGVNLEVAAGGVMSIGPVDQLYGVFDDTPVTIASGVTLDFASAAGVATITGRFADPLGGDGGAFVLNDLADFSGTLANFAPGDELIFPGLTTANVNSLSGSHEITVSGANLTQTVNYTIAASLAAGLSFFTLTDAGGDPAISVRAATAQVNSLGEYAASNGFAQPLLGIDLGLTTSTTQSLVLTLLVTHGTLSDGLTHAANLTLAAGSLAALNTELADLVYSGTGSDQLTITSSSGLLSGVYDIVPIITAVAGSVSGYQGGVFSEGQVASFGNLGGLISFSVPAAFGAADVTGQVAFENVWIGYGLSGTALDVDGGGLALFDSAASATLGGNVTIGDGGGAGSLVVVSDAVSVGGNLSIAVSGNGNGSAADVFGAVTLAGTLFDGVGGGAGALTLAAGGSFRAAAATVGSAGSFTALGGTASFTGAFVEDGSLVAAGTAALSAGLLDFEDAATLGGHASFSAGSGAVSVGVAGALNVGTDAQLSAGALTVVAGLLTDSGLVSISGAAQFGGHVSLSGGTLDAGAITLAGGLLVGTGVVNATSIVNSSDIFAAGGTFVLGGSLSNNGVVQIGNSAALDLAGGISGSAISFAGAAGELTIDDPARFGVNVVNMSASDVIDIVGFGTGEVSYAGGNVTVANALGSVITSFALGTVAAQPAVSIVSDGYGGSLITLGDELPCFARGTRILTPGGYRAVEMLGPGDPVITLSGAKRPVRWVGWRTLDLAASRAWFARPVVILPDAFGPGQPVRPLKLSPLHCVYVDGVLLPATHLVNGVNIVRASGEVAMTYYHVELDRHDVVLAEGLACETYMDTGNRGGLYQEIGRRSPARRAFADTVTRGPRLAAVRRRLHQRAVEAGFSTTYWPVVHAVAGEETVAMEFRRLGRWRMAQAVFSAPVREIVLISAVATPADTDPDSEDARELGICLGDIPGVQVVEGAYPRAGGDDGVWLGRRARLRLEKPVAELVMPVAAVVRSWALPVDGGQLDV
jgi:hypothetical protein